MRNSLISGIILILITLLLFFPGTFSAVKYLAYEEAQYYANTGPSYYKPYDAYYYHLWGYEQVPRVRPNPVCNSVYGLRFNCNNDCAYSVTYFRYMAKLS
jgi:hypothetical protein